MPQLIFFLQIHKFSFDTLTLNIVHGPNNAVRSDLISRSLTDWFKPISERPIAPVQLWCTPIVQCVPLMAYSHCKGTGPVPVQGQNVKYSTMYKGSHNSDTGAGTKTHSSSLYWYQSHSCAV